jgi:hypothetical protein
MIPIPTAIPWRTIAALTLGSCLFGAGWTANGWRKDAQIADLTRAHAQETLAATQAARADEQRRTAAQQEIANAATKEAESARNDARAAGDAAERLRVRVAELVAASRASDPAPAGSGPAAGDTDTLLAELFRRADERAGSLASDLDAARIAGQACERAYNALTAHFSREPGVD